MKTLAEIVDEFRPYDWIDWLLIGGVIAVTAAIGVWILTGWPA